jgi:hypothetical protein
MIGDIVGEVVGSALKFIGRIFVEVVFELLIKGAGYILCRPFSMQSNARCRSLSSRAMTSDTSLQRRGR